MLSGGAETACDGVVALILALQDSDDSSHATLNVHIVLRNAALSLGRKSNQTRQAIALPKKN